MPRIRSLHPGQWTDEEFVSCSFPARLLAIALRNEADDNGIFEWKPAALKMRLIPADPVDVSHLLEELEAHNIILRFVEDGRSYGAIRNFCKYQRPQKPKTVHPITPEMRAYVGLKEEAPLTSSKLVKDQSWSGHEPVPDWGEQRKEGGGSRNGTISPIPLAGDSPQLAPSQNRSALSKKSESGKRQHTLTRAHPLPADWRPTEEDWNYARDATGMREDEIETEIQLYRDHRISRGIERVDWAADWRTWISREAKARRSKRSGTGPPGEVGSPAGLQPADDPVIAQLRRKDQVDALES